MADDKAALDQDIQAQNAVLQTVVANLQTVTANVVKILTDVDMLLAKGGGGIDLSAERQAVQSQTATLTTAGDSLQQLAAQLAAGDTKANA